MKNKRNIKIIFGIVTVILLSYTYFYYSYDTWQSHYNAGVALYKKGKYTEAMIEYKKAEALNNNQSYIYNNMGVILGRQGSYQEALNNYNKAITIDKNNYESHKNKFCPLYNLQLYEEAIETCDRAIEIQPKLHNTYEVYSNKALAFNKLEIYEEAIKAANKALELNPQYPVAMQAKEHAEAKIKEKKLWHTIREGGRSL